MRRAAISLTVFVALLAGAGCGGEPEDHSKDESIENFEVGPARQGAVVIKPGRATRRVVIYMHGAGETIQNAFREPRKDPIFRTLLDGGYAVAMTDAHGDNWGNRASERDQIALVAALRERDLHDVYVLALSMGGFNGLQLLDDVPVKAWAGIFPACDLASVYALGLYRGQIRTAYGRTGKRLGDAISRRSPVDFERSVDGLPMRFWASPGDRVIPKRDNTDACASLARRHGARVEVTITSGDHGDATNYNPEAVLRLFDSA